MLKLKSTSKFINNLYNCEYGRYEDAMSARRAGDAKQIKRNNYDVVVCDFLDRHKTVIEVRNNAELSELYYALASGTIGLYACKAANKLLDQIRDDVKAFNPELVRRFPFQNGM